MDGFETINGVECVRLSVTGLGFYKIDTIWLRLDNFQEAKYRSLKKIAEKHLMLKRFSSAIMSQRTVGDYTLNQMKNMLMIFWHIPFKRIILNLTLGSLIPSLK